MHNKPRATAKYLEMVISFSLSLLYIIVSIIAERASSCNYPINIKPIDKEANAAVSHERFGSLTNGNKVSKRSYLLVPAYAIPKPITAPCLVASSFAYIPSSNKAFAVSFSS